MNSPARSDQLGSPKSLFLFGGSSFYTLLLVESLRRSGVLAGLGRITLFGRDEQRLAALVHLCGQLCVGEAVRFDATTELGACVDDEYELLFNQLRFGGMQARDLDEKLAIRHGLVADETLGIVGVTNAVRTIHGLTPLLEALRRKRQPYTLVNFTNPCSIVTQYLIGHQGVPAVGICDYPEVLRAAYARLVGVPRAELELGYFGVNHFGFIHDVRHRGASVFAEVKARLDECPLAPAYHRAFSSIVIPSWDLIFDRHTVSERQRRTANRASFLYAIEQELAALVRQTPLAELSPAPFLARLSERNCDWYDLIVTPVLSNLLGQTATPLVLNLGAADVLGLGCAPCVLESNAALGPAGHVPVPVAPALATSYEGSLVRQLKRAELELLEACLGRSPEQLLGACLMNPMIQDHRAARAYLDDAAAADPQLAELLPPARGRTRSAEPPPALAREIQVENTNVAFDLTRFQSQGYLQLPGFVQGAELQALQRELAALIADRSLMVPREGSEHFFQKYQSTSYCYVDRHAHAPTLAALLEAPRLRAIVAALLADRGTFHASLVQYHKAGEGQAIPWHQDIDAELLGAGKMFNFLIYPHDLDLESGALFVVPGSHGSARLPWGEPHGELPGQVAVCARAGELVITDCTLFHKVNHNHSGRDRMSVNLRFRHQELNLKQSSVGIYRNGRVNYAG